MYRHRLTAALLSFVYHWQDFLDPLIYLSDFMTYPISLGLRMYQSMAGTWANLLMATSLIALVPVVIVFFLCERYVMRSLGVVGEIHK
jgi:multiple sugar transport system permease protein